MTAPASPPAPTPDMRSGAAAWSAGWRIGWAAAWDAGQGGEPVPPVRPSPSFARGYEAGAEAMKEQFPTLARSINREAAS